MKAMYVQRVILAGGCCLAFGAAFANIGVVLETGISVSHLTGDISRVSMDLSHPSPVMLREALLVGGAALSFLLGAFLAGFLIHHPTLDFARPYGRTVTGIGMLLIASGLLIPAYPLAGIALAAFGCGIQNSLASSYRGIVLRTTHLTGLMTDFGVALGMKARGCEVNSSRFVVPGLLIVSFFLGGVVSGVVFFSGKYDVIVLAGCGYVLAGLAWSVGKRVAKRGGVW
ncbi:DUF1275 domain-containing protein [Akkermansiaceae bacterium]|nr:DUF1275 domain-containing protein [Akkermansiaceae bacterium]